MQHQNKEFYRIMVPRNEYPRPQFERTDWLNLNGEWTYAFDFSRSGDEREWRKATSFEGRITVPFCPESRLSGVGFTDFIEMMWYHRKLEIPAEWADRKILLHFGGVDYKAIVYLDGTEAGRHTGGASPFTVDLTGKAEPGKTHDLVVRVEDEIRNGLQPFGKQSPTFKSRACNYTRTTGIWQTVWMEAVSPYALKSCRIIPDFDNGAFSFLPVFHQERRGLRLSVTLLDNGQEAASETVAAGNGSMVTLRLKNPKAWDTEHPFLYDIRYVLKDENGNVLDQVSSYAGLRKIHIEDGKCCLNNQPVFLRFVLDQGFYEDGIWTAPDDNALRRDIELSMKAGFNGARLHQKIFDERFHYWADRLGYLTWAEYPSWGISFWQHFGKTNPNYNLTFRDYLAEWTALVERDINHPSIVAWTPLNETCGYHDLEEHRRIIADVYDLTRTLDSTRPVNDTSGYVHVKTDLWTVHTYHQTDEELSSALNQSPVFMHYPEVEAEAYHGQPYLMDEYGGVGFIPEDRKPYADNSWGYNKETLTQEEAEKRIAELTGCIVKNPKAAGYCYTQLTDIEQEQNGIYNYDRTPKFDAETIRNIFSMKPSWSKL